MPSISSASQSFIATNGDSQLDFKIEQPPNERESVVEVVRGERVAKLEVDLRIEREQSRQLARDGGLQIAFVVLDESLADDGAETDRQVGQ